MQTSLGVLCPARRARPWSVISSIAMAVLVGAPITLWADDVPLPSAQERLKTWKRDVAEHRKGKKLDLLKKDFQLAADLYKSSSDDPKFQGKVIAAIGVAARGSKDEELHKMVLFALSDLKDLRGARYVKPYLKQPDKKKASNLLDVAVAAAGDLPGAMLVEPLLAIVRKSKHMGILGDAVRALGKFGKVKRKRVKILEALVDAAKKAKPGGRPRMRGPREDMSGGTDGSSDPGAPVGREAGPGARWNTLSRSVPGALTELTGLRQNQITDWFVLVKDSKGRLKNIFQRD